MINNLKIVPIEEIPLAVDVPIDDLNKVHEICLQMEEICTKNKGIGLAAVQVGIPWKLFIVDTQQGFQHYVNCEYEPAGEKIKSKEGCLSIKKDGRLVLFEVDRYEEVTVKGFELVKDRLDKVDLVIKGIYAIVFQHEIDHQRNILISSGRLV